MSLKFFLIASFFVALLTMLGGAPMCRHIAAKLHPRMVRSQTAVGVGGVTMALALLLVSFYLTPLPANAVPVLYAIALLLAFNGVLWWSLPRKRARLWRNRVGPLVMLIAMFGIIGLPTPLIFDYTGVILTAGAAVVLTLTPLALAGIGDRFPVRSAMSSSYLIVPAMLGTLTIGLHHDYSSGPAFASMVSVLQVLMPTFGAIAGCSFYTLHLPWRSGVRVRMGASGQMIMGVIAGWAAIQMAANGERPGATMVALMWMMLPALFEVAREQIRLRVAPTLDPAQIDPRLINLLLEPSSKVVIYGNSIVMMIIGLVSFWSPFVSVWASGVAIPFAFGVYVVFGGWLSGLPVDARSKRGGLKPRDARR